MRHNQRTRVDKVSSHQLDIARTAVVGAIAIGACHFVWVVCVMTSTAQAIVDFLFWAHFIKPIYLVEPFDFGRAIILLVLATMMGAIFGGSFAALWNRFHRGQR